MKKIIPIVVIKNIEDTIPILSALRDGGINCAEITFRTPCAREALALAVEAFPDMDIGAGTIISRAQCLSAIEVGAKFIVSPGFSDDVAKICVEEPIPYYPGCVTPTEVMSALHYGLTTIKFFPAGLSGGLKAIKALAAVFPELHFIPTGGVNPGNIREYLDYDKVVGVGGTWLLDGDIVANCEEVLRICES
ncbi:MAG: bifunctional 4-hydroxy-2-oxoglutarate aldolase/2-dehydro-3-deoxy-phosphogluconate aldolase [Clostridia bacterium]|nr:bifunctional 4-hydroxy-2-oxoglutarate aldolase/2-dehydro-3-deoxy-phosphogluconate aldolase [Clostridia bacterium]